MPPVAAAVGSIIGGAGAAVGGTAAAIGSTVGATAAAVPAIAGATVKTVTGLGTSIPAAVGGISGVAKSLEPAAELFGAGVGIYSAAKQVGFKKKELDIAAQQAANQKEALRLQAQQDASLPYIQIPVEPMQTYASTMPFIDQAKVALPEKSDLMTYAPLILIGIAIIFLGRKIWK